MSKKLIEAIKIGNLQEIERIFCEKVFNRIGIQKEKLAETLIAEKEKTEPEVEIEPEPEPEVEPEEKPEIDVKFTKFQPKPAHYRYYFRFNSKLMAVDFVPTNVSRTAYKAFVYNRGKENSDKILVRMGISNINQIPELFNKITSVITQFVKMRKPLSLKFVPDENGDLQFPNIIHQYIYPVLNDFSKNKNIRGLYAISRGDGSTDGSAFHMKRGAATQTNIKSRGWRPSPISKQTKNEEISNVTGAAVSTDIPFMPNQGLLPRKSMIKRKK